MTNTTGQTWGALRKAWKGYKISKVQGKQLLMRLFAYRVRKLEGELKIKLALFPDLSITGVTIDEAEIQHHSKLEKEYAENPGYGK